MVYSVNFKNLAGRVNPIVFVKYLRDNKWNQYDIPRQYVKIFQKNIDGDDFQVNIPLDKSLSDFEYAMYKAIETVSFAEKKTIGQMLLFLLNPNSDILKIRLEYTTVEQGNILFDDAIKVYDNAKKLLTAAAQDVVHPRPYHRGRVDDSITEFINRCKFGQTEIGSYIVPIICPFAELDEDGMYRELSLFSNEDECTNSLTRKVTNKVMTNISNIRDNIDNGKYGRLAISEGDSIISANFYEALTGMNIKTEGVSLEFVAQWSPAIKANRASVNRVKISSEYYQPILEAIRKLRPHRDEVKKIIGRVKSLTSSPDAEKRTSGRVSVVYLDDNDTGRTVNVDLCKEDYEKALKAHSMGSYVEVFGKFSNNGIQTTSMGCESFNIVD